MENKTSVEPAGEATEPTCSVSHCLLLPSMRAGMLLKGRLEVRVATWLELTLSCQVSRQEKGTQRSLELVLLAKGNRAVPKHWAGPRLPRCLIYPIRPGMKGDDDLAGMQVWVTGKQGCWRGGESQIHRMALWQEQEWTGASAAVGVSATCPLL